MEEQAIQRSCKSFKLKKEIHPQVSKSYDPIKICENILVKI